MFVIFDMQTVFHSWFSIYVQRLPPKRKSSIPDLDKTMLAGASNALSQADYVRKGALLAVLIQC
jgi:hypothetical protein